MGSGRIEVNSDGGGAPDGDEALDGGGAPDNGGAPDGDTENEADAAESPRADGPARDDAAENGRQGADDDPMLIVIRFKVFKDKEYITNEPSFSESSRFSGLAGALLRCSLVRVGTVDILRALVMFLSG